jgi:hypothetical protein
MNDWMKKRRLLARYLNAQWQNQEYLFMPLENDENALRFFGRLLLA